MIGHDKITESFLSLRIGNLVHQSLTSQLVSELVSLSFLKLITYCVSESVSQSVFSKIESPYASVPVVNILRWEENSWRRICRRQYLTWTFPSETKNIFLLTLEGIKRAAEVVRLMVWRWMKVYCTADGAWPHEMDILLSVPKACHSCNWDSSQHVSTFLLAQIQPQIAWELIKLDNISTQQHLN